MKEEFSMSMYASKDDLIAAMRAHIDALQARLESLEKDAARLMYMAKDMDGFVHVDRDKYDYAIECMEEAGREEVSEEDEIKGLRRMIDAAMQSANKGE